MANPKDDWEKPRSKGQHLTEDEIGLLRTSYKAGHTAREAARALKCSSRIACKYYSYFKAEGIRKGFDRDASDRVHKSNRFYKASFEL